MAVVAVEVCSSSSLLSIDHIYQSPCMAPSSSSSFRSKQQLFSSSLYSCPSANFSSSPPYSSSSSSSLANSPSSCLGTAAKSPFQSRIAFGGAAKNLNRITAGGAARKLSRIPIRGAARKPKVVAEIHFSRPAISSRSPDASVSGKISARPVQAAITDTAPAGDGLKWWERGGAPNISDVHNAEDFLGALQRADDKLVVVEFYATWCGSCRALYPKFCQIAAEYSDAVFLKVNFDENKQMCKSLMVKVLPFFHIYRGREGRLDSFSCSLSKVQKLKDAVAKHHDCVGEECAVPEPLGDTLGPIPSADLSANAAGSSE